MSTKKEAKREYLLREARRIFVDTDNWSEYDLIGYCRLFKALYEDQPIADNCASISGLTTTYRKLSEEAERAIYLRYFLNMTYNEMLTNMYPIHSIATIRLIVSNALDAIRAQAKSFYFPERQKFLLQYAAFFGAITSGRPSSDDIPVRQLGLSTRTGNALHRAGVFTASQMHFKTDEELLKIRNLGHIGVEEIHKMRQKLFTGII